MKKNYLLTLLLGFLITNVSAQFTMDDVQFWIGSGPDSSVLVVDFKDGVEDSSYAWGFIYDAADDVTFADMLGEIAGAEPNFDFTAPGGFLNNLTFNTHAGLGGSPDYWSTWSGTDLASMTMNAGISEVLENGRWLGLSYGFSNPEAQQPATPWAAYSSLWFDADDVDFWVGSGQDSAVLVIDFVESGYGEATTFAYGVKFNGSITGAQMLALVDAADVNLSVNAAAFLNDITYNNFEGIGGDPYYWGTFSGTNMSDWTFNAGISTAVTNGGWFGCTYDAWAPRRPFIPVPANDPGAVTIEDVQSWVGSGQDSAVIVIDFNDGGAPESFVFGYLFNGTSTGQAALNAIATLSNLDIDMAGGYLNDITYLTHAGIGGTNDFYWGTWSAENNGNWIMNDGINTSLSNGDWFGCSFTDWNPALPPSTPAIAPNTSSLAEVAANAFAVYPNPVKDKLHIQGSKGLLTVSDVTGKVVFTAVHTGFSTVDFSQLNAGIYMVSVDANGAVATQTVVK